MSDDVQSDEPIKMLDVKEFRELGYLQELNRKFLHPLGLALSVRVAEDGSETLAGIWDYRDDPEGMLFGEPNTMDRAKAIRIERERFSKVKARDALGCQNGIQPMRERPR